MLALTAIPSNFVLSAALILPAALVVAAEIEMAGAAPPLEMIGAVPVTLVTVPTAGAVQLVPPLPLVVRTYPFIPRFAGRVRLIPVPFPFIVNEPPMVVFPFFSKVKALLRAASAVPLPTTKSLSVDTKAVAFPVPTVEYKPSADSP